MTTMVDRKELASALALACKVVERRTSVPLLACVHLSVAGGRLEITGTDLETTVRAGFDVTSDGDWCAVVSAHELKDVVDTLPKAPILTLELVGDQPGELRIGAGGASASLASLDRGDWPAELVEPGEPAFQVDGKALAQMLGRTAFAMSKEETRYYLNGVHLTYELGPYYPDRMPRVAVTATDGHRLAHATCAAPDGAEAWKPAIVCRKAVPLIEAIAKAGGAAAVSEALDGRQFRHVAVTTGDVSIVTKAVDGTFPDFWRVIPERGNRWARIDAAGLLEAARAVAKAATDRCAAMRLTFNCSAVHVASASSAGPKVERDVTVPETTLGNGAEIGFNARYVVDLCRALGGKGEVELALTNESSPCRITVPGEPDWLGVQMPLRV